jgi:hypothetical protein
MQSLSPLAYPFLQSSESFSRCCDSLCLIMYHFVWKNLSFVLRHVNPKYLLVLLGLNFDRLWNHAASGTRELGEVERVWVALGHR